MALVCDSKSEPAKPDEATPASEVDNEDLEDGEIEDDGDDEVPTEESAVETKPEIVQPQLTLVDTTPNKNIPPEPNKPIGLVPDKIERDRSRNRMKEKPNESVERHRHEEREKKTKHMTEAEKSILHLRKRERMQREMYNRKEGKYNFALVPVSDDFARNLEKSLASVLKKDKTASEDEKEEDKRGRKRKKHDRDRQKLKQKKLDSPKSEEIDENEMLNIKGGSPDMRMEEKRDRMERPSPPGHSEDSFESEYSSETERMERRERRKEFKGKHKGKNRQRKYNRDRSKERRNEMHLKDSQGVCVFYLQGKCQKNDCPYSHEAVPPMKLELCKFYLMDCCAKGEKCLYMHSDFPCKFYHTGLVCNAGDNCKFAHGKPLTDGLKQILFKHIETAPRDILGGFPRMSREEALNMINMTQKSLLDNYGEKKEASDSSGSGKGGGLIPSLFDINIPVPPELADETKAREKPEKPSRNRPSRWQDLDPNDASKGMQDQNKQPGFGIKPFAYGKDQDMRISSNGDVDMRTLPPSLSNLSQAPSPALQGLPPSAGAPGTGVCPSGPVSAMSELRQPSELDVEQYKRDAGYADRSSQSAAAASVAASAPRDVDIRPKAAGGDVDIRQLTVDPRLLSVGDVDIRQLSAAVAGIRELTQAQAQAETDSGLGLGLGLGLAVAAPDLPMDLPKTQRDLFMRIKAHQKDATPDSRPVEQETEDVAGNINWYSDDDDDDENRLMIKVDGDDCREDNQMETDVVATTTPLPQLMSPPILKPQEVVEKLGDLSKIDISAEVSKLLSSISKSTAGSLTPKESKPAIRDPRQAASSDPRMSSSVSSAALVPPADPRRSSRNSTETQPKAEKISIYEQGGLDMEMKNIAEEADYMKLDSDLRGIGRPDVDLRHLQLPFKGMQNYTPATEIDASVSSHPAMPWRVHLVEIPRPDYTGLKLSVSDAEKTGDPRLRKIFRLSVDEKDSPASPRASPRRSPAGHGGPLRLDPRLKKLEEAKQLASAPQDRQPVATMSYMQQLNVLQSSAFYQSLTSNQKLLLNQELAARADQSGSHDPVLNSLLTNLNIVPAGPVPVGGAAAGPAAAIAMSILANVGKLNPMMAGAPGQNVNPAMLVGQNAGMMNAMAQNMGQPGLLGAAPGIPNMPAEFQINFDPRNGGLLGNAPSFPGFQQEGPGYGGFGDDFYPEGGPPPNSFASTRGDRGGFNRDRRRGRGGFTRGGNRHSFRTNRNNMNNNAINNSNRPNNRGHTPP